LTRLVGHDLTVTDVTFSPDGKFIATSSEDTTVRMRDWRTAKVPSTRYRGLGSRAGLLAHETYFYIGYLLLPLRLGGAPARRVHAVVGRRPSQRHARPPESRSHRIVEIRAT
jgi:hypothetical protein